MPRSAKRKDVAAAQRDESGGKPLNRGPAVLLTFTGFHDPFARGLVGEEDQAGPVLTLVSAWHFDQIILFSTPATREISASTKDAIAQRHGVAKVRIIDLDLSDPTDYRAILGKLRSQLTSLQDEFVDGDFYIAAASGTPQMHAAWVLLTASGEIPAKLLNVRPPRFVTKDRPLVSVIDLAANEFPTVRARFIDRESVPSPVSHDINAAVRELNLVGDHPEIQRAIDLASALADSNLPILIRGETGTGKELFARLIHIVSGRPRNLFITVNCAAIPENLLESVLFGHVKGAFTGAFKDQKGKFELANQGTLFLDELGELPLPAQAKLLRILQNGIVEPVGAEQGRRVDVRVVAATNRDVAKAMQMGSFREDLYYRLSGGEVILPPLRKRKTDIPKIALLLLDRINSTLRSPKRFSQAALKRLQSHRWPGNVRDLENVIERSVRLCRSEILEADDLLIGNLVAHVDPFEGLPEPSYGFSLDDFLGSARKQLILRALEAAGGNQSKAARLLGITPQAVSKFLRLNQNYNRGGKDFNCSCNS